MHVPGACEEEVGKRYGRTSLGETSGTINNLSVSALPSFSSSSFSSRQPVGSLPVRTLSLRDAFTGKLFLVDSGADISVIPATKSDKLSSPGPVALQAANGTTIDTYGRRSVSIKLPGGTVVQQSFLVANVARPILGADFFSQHDLIIDLKRRRLLRGSLLGDPDHDGVTHVPVTVLHADSSLLGLQSVLKEPTNKFTRIVHDEFPAVLTPQFGHFRNAHGVEHFIPTRGPPVFSKSRRLSPEKLQQAKAAFDKLIVDGIIRPSKSPWASPLHMVPKQDGTWRPCGDFRRLNTVTEDDRYPLPHIQDFAAGLAGARYFSVLDLQRGYHQIPMAAEDVPKTAIITHFGLYEYLRMPFGLKTRLRHFNA